MGSFLQAADEAEALELLHEMGCTDGLPVVIPTDERVARMVLASGQAADMVLGEMGPGKGTATISKVASAAVMAGCIPDYMPLVVAAVSAVIDPVFDLTEMQATTHCTAPLIIVNGPARESCGPVASGFGALGPGHRANASIGRALRLCMINIGGGRPGVSDMALLGHPGKFTYCLAEDEENSPFTPLHVSLGFQAQDSVVTVIGAEAPHSVIYSTNADDPDNADKCLFQIAQGLAGLATNNAILTGGSAVVVLNPEHAQVLADANMNRESVARRLWELTHVSSADRLAYGQQFTAWQKTKDVGTTYPAFPSPENILVITAGGVGLYSMVMPSWSAGAHSNSPVSVQVDHDQFCEI
ncbi:MAG: hypothetical protein ACI9ON_002151 [Limisphaerales bacterium]